MRRSNGSKQNQVAINHIIDPPYKEAMAFLNNVSVKDKTKVSGVVRAMASQKNIRRVCFSRNTGALTTRVSLI